MSCGVGSLLYQPCLELNESFSPPTGPASPSTASSVTLFDGAPLERLREKSSKHHTVPHGISPSPSTHLSIIRSGAAQLKPKKRSQVCSSSKALLSMRLFQEELFPAVDGATQDPEVDSIQGLIQKIPFDFLRASVPEQQASSVETWVRDELPALFASVLLGADHAKAKTDSSTCLGISPNPAHDGLCIRCGRVSGTDEFEVYVRYLATHGGSKKLYKQIFLSGHQQGQVFAYGKPIKDEFFEFHLREMTNEIAINEQLRSSCYIVPMIEVMKRKNFFILKGVKMPWCDGNNVHTHCLKPADESSYRDRLQIALDVANGVQEMHKRDLCHMDLKSPNVLLQRDGKGWKALLCDFGRTCSKNTVFYLPRSSRAFLAPEQIAVDVPSAPSMDMWSLGLILLEMMHGIESNLFFVDKERGPILLELLQPTHPGLCLDGVTKDFYADAFYNPFDFPALAAYWSRTQSRIVQKLDDSLPVDRLIKQLLSIDPAQRPTAAEVVEEIEKIMAQLLV